jgi:enoyl-CoA hydratase/carnithine racemase
MEELMSDLTSDTVAVDLDDSGVATIELRRPPNNYIDTAVVAAIADALESLDESDNARVAVLCSQGKHFCAGAALKAGSEEKASTTQRHLYDEAIRIFRCKLPIVAAVQGAAVGGGLGLALAADFRVSGPGSRFTANFARLGFHHGFGLSVTLPRVVGHQRALAILLGAERFDGNEAARLGLVDLLVPDDAIRAEALAFARGIAGNAPLAVRSIRETLRADLADAVAEALVHERAEQTRLAATSDFAEGVSAMTDRREPDFVGR